MTNIQNFDSIELRESKVSYDACSENRATKANHFGSTAMIGFSCTNCGHTFSVQDQYEGQRIKCPKCACVGVVVDNSGSIKVICQNCGNENSVPEILDGQEIKCPKCNNTVVPASIKKEPAESADNNLKEKSPQKSKKLEISERGLIIIISVAAAVIVIGLIIIAAVRIGN